MRKETIGDCELYLGDCRDITLPDCDALVCDPPYGIGESNKKNLSRCILAKPKDYGDYDWDKEPIEQMVLDDFRALCKYQIIFGGNYYQLPPTKCWLVWDKLNGKNDFADCELAWTNLDKAVRRIQWLWNGMIRQGQEERFHPTQKPLEVMRWCLGHLPADTKTVLDPFMGSGTTGMACATMGLKFIGVEREQAYFDIACRRIEDAYKQSSLVF